MLRTERQAARESGQKQENGGDAETANLLQGRESSSDKIVRHWMVTPSAEISAAGSNIVEKDLNGKISTGCTQHIAIRLTTVQSYIGIFIK